MRRLAAIVVVVVMVVHADDSVIPMPVPVADVNSDRTHSDFDVFCHDRRLIAGVRRTGKCRHGQERNSEQGKQSIPHNTTLSLVGKLRPDTCQSARLPHLKSV
jgi:hypothetical protein